MVIHEAFLRSAKRRKIDHSNPQASAPAPPAVQSIQNAVLGRSSPFSYNAQSTRSIAGSDVLADSTERTSTNGIAKPDTVELGTFADSAHHSTFTPEDLPPEGNDVDDLSSKAKGGRPAKKRQQMPEAAGINNEVETLETPSRRKRKKYRARSGSLQGNASTQTDRHEFVAEDHGSTGAGGNDTIAVDLAWVQRPGKAEKEGADIDGNSVELDAANNYPEGLKNPGVVMEDGTEGKQSDIEDYVSYRRDRSSGRQRRRPRRYSTEMAEAIILEHTPTTSSSRQRGRKKKASAVVTNAESEDELQLGFEHIPTTFEPPETVPPVEALEPDPIPAQDAMPVDEVTITPKKKRGRPSKAALNTPVTPRGPSLLSVKESAPENNDQVSLNDHFQSLRTILQRNGAIERLTMLKKHILGGLTGKRRLPLVGLDAEYQKVHQIVEQTIVAGEGNSMLVIGARGSAKTSLVETVISDLAIHHREDFYVVRLNGFIHTDDKLALREIWRQLGKEMEVEDDAMGFRSNYADTLASLLALLSHPAELAEVDADQAAKSVIFVMDEFDLFTTHPRQTLLYNLFDIAQSKKAPIAVLGLTTRVDVVESLEKRVKSRFSHRYVHLSLPKSFTAFQDICKAALAVHDPPLGYGNDSDHALQSNPAFDNLQTAWSNYVDSLFESDTTFKHHLLTIYHLTKSVPSFLTTSLLPIASLSASSIPTGTCFAASTLTPPDSKLHILIGLSDLQLSLLIAAARLDIILDTDTCNFNMAYDEYQMLASRVKIQSSASGAAAVGAGSKVWGKEVASGAWEILAEYELIMPAVGGGSGVGGGNGTRDVGRAGRMWRVDVGLEEIAPSVPGLSGMMAKWCKEI
ncbi:hypothetical protein MMC08_002365 [Hypocenomyce scalaris]|nr:hypothetical protein [Hypocenomyce scalaris]